MDSVNEVLQNLRASYLGSRFDIEDCAQHPEDQFEKWLKEAINSYCDEPNAFVLSTIKDNKPRARVLLLKGLIEEKFVFYTNYKSAKGSELDLNQNVALTFLWLPLQRQIRIEGKISKVPSEWSDSYFQKRPRGSQIGAIASPQSQRVQSRQELEDRFEQVEQKFGQQEKIPRPLHWGGYGVTAEYFEFWQGRSNRMHDRICYEKKGSSWDIYRLAP